MCNVFPFKEAPLFRNIPQPIHHRPHNASPTLMNSVPAPLKPKLALTGPEKEAVDKVRDKT